jgi:hypothetical protein
VQGRYLLVQGKGSRRGYRNNSRFRKNRLVRSPGGSDSNRRPMPLARGHDRVGAKITRRREFRTRFHPKRRQPCLPGIIRHRCVQIRGHPECPQGDDKPVKYPLIFKVTDMLIINKIDYHNCNEFDMDSVKSRVKILNPSSSILSLSCCTGQGMEEWISWLREEVVSCAEG